MSTEMRLERWSVPTCHSRSPPLGRKWHNAVTCTFTYLSLTRPWGLAERDETEVGNSNVPTETAVADAIGVPRKTADESIAKVCSYQLGLNAAYPSYELSNLGGNLKRNRDRLAQLERKAT